MVKKRAKKKSSKRSVSRSPVKRISKSVVVKHSASVKPTRRRLNLVLKNLVLFVILSIISYILSVVVEGGTYVDFFEFLSMILGAIALAFLIALLVLLFLKGMKKK